MTKTLIIAEIGSSHNSSFDRAVALIDAAADAGADYAKFQLFTGDDLWSREPELTNTRKVALPEAWIPKLMQRCVDKKIAFLCTPFSPHAVEVLRKNGATSYKISSGDITYRPLLEAVAETHRLVYLSVGASTFEEIDAALAILKNAEDVVILHCVPEYPATPATANMRRILDLIERYKLGKNIGVGLSSHLREWWVDVAAVPFGLTCIEKHIDTVGKTGPEGGHSLDPFEFTQFVTAVREVEQAMEVHKEFTEGEVYARLNYRRNPTYWTRPLQS
jgi:sialic acid synthase SpsE